MFTSGCAAKGSYSQPVVVCCLVYVGLAFHAFVSLLQDKKAQEEDKQWQVEKAQQQQHLRSQLAAQTAEREAQREAERQAKLREVQETNEALAAAYQAQLQEMQQHKAAQQRQWNLYRCVHLH